MNKRRTLPASQLISLVTNAHETTLQVVGDLSDEQLTVPKMEIVNPFLWELGHVAFFYDVFLLRTLGSEEFLLKGAENLYDSFKVDHDDRWDLPFPSREETLAYKQRVFEEVVSRLDSREPDANRLAYQVSYTVSKLLSTAALGFAGSNFLSDPANVEFDKGRPPFDRPKILTANLIYRTPGLAGSSPWARGLLGDWETAVIWTANDGRVETVQCCTNFTGTRANRPDQIADSKGPTTVDQWFNINAFAPPTEIGRLGRSPRGQIRGPGIDNFDLSFMKNFPGVPWFTPESATIQFRAEFFNAFNQTQFQFINTAFPLSNITIDENTGELLTYNMTNANFGKVTRIREPREIQFGLKIIW